MATQKMTLEELEEALGKAARERAYWTATLEAVKETQRDIKKIPHPVLRLTLYAFFKTYRRGVQKSFDIAIAKLRKLEKA